MDHLRITATIAERETVLAVTGDMDDAAMTDLVEYARLAARVGSVRIVVDLSVAYGSVSVIVAALRAVQTVPRSAPAALVVRVAPRLHALLAGRLGAWTIEGVGER